jgi:hypothetical protein
MVVFMTLFFSKSLAQTKFDKLSMSYVVSLPTYGKLLHGFDFEYYRSLNKRFGVSANIEFGRYNTFPQFANGGTNVGLNPNQQIVDYIYENVRLPGELWSKANQQIYSVSGYYFPLVTDKNSVYISTGVGMNIQDALDFGIESTKVKLYQDGSTELVSYENFISQRAANTLVVLLGTGYDYNIGKDLVLGINARLQLPLIRDKNVWVYGGAGFDDILRFGIKFGKKF